jgi:esterase
MPHAGIVIAGHIAFIHLQQQLWHRRFCLSRRKPPCRLPHTPGQTPPCMMYAVCKAFAPRAQTLFQQAIHPLRHLLNRDRAHEALIAWAPPDPHPTGIRRLQQISTPLALQTHCDYKEFMLALTHYPAEQTNHQLPLLIVHGLFGSARNWGVVARHLAATRDVVAVDQRNHGHSPRHASHSYTDMAADLAEVIAHIGGPMDVLGHSMGGKAAMMLALTSPQLIRRLIVADIAPVAYAHDNTQHTSAMLAMPLDGITARSEADRRLSATVPDPALRAFFLQSLDLKSQPPVWRLNLPVLANQMPLIVGWPAVSGQFPNAALFLSGGKSHYVLPEHRPVIRALFPKARFAKLPEAGHWLHADAPRAFEETVEVFLSAAG